MYLIISIDPDPNHEINAKNEILGSNLYEKMVLHMILSWLVKKIWVAIDHSC